MLEATKYIKQLKATSGGNDKKVILRKAAISGCFELFEAFQLAYNSRKVFGIKKVPVIDEGGFTPEELSQPGVFGWNDFISLANKLLTRTITGNAAKTEVMWAAENACIDDWNNLFRSVILKDMRCGVTETTVNKILTEIGGDCLKYLIPVWSVQLADDAKKHPKKMKGKKAIDPKLDGMRMTALLDKESGTVEMYTRNGIRNDNFTHISEKLLLLLEEIPGSIVLDGEIMSASFQELMTQANRKHDIDTSESYYGLFDIIPYADFQNGICKTGLKDRHDVLVSMCEALQRISGETITVIPKLYVDLDTDEGQQKMEEFYSEMVGLGYEGIMVKDVDASYECKRTQSWLKWKPVESADLTIVAVEPGAEGKRRAGVMGNLVATGEYDGKQISTSIGTGFSDAQLKEFWENRDQLIGEIIEVEFDTLTKNKNSDTWSCRFPRFKRFRSIGLGKI